MVTAFNPPPALLELVDAVRPQVTAVVVVNDGSTIGLDTLDAVANRPDVDRIDQPNAGVAAALNAGLRFALADEEVDAVLTLDQDTGLPPGYVAATVDALLEAARRGVWAATVSAATYDGHPAPTAGTVRGLTRAFDPMQSGTLIPRTTVDWIGLYDESLVIDAVDSEFTVRALAAGLHPLIASGAELGHGQGEQSTRRILGRDLGYNHHSADRVYTMSRNGTRLTTRYARTQPRWVARRLLEEAKAHTLRLALDPERAALARAALAGMRDGLRPSRAPRL